MRFCRYELEGTVSFGLIENVRGVPTIVRRLTKAVQGASDFEHGENVDVPLGAVRLLAPTQPSKVVCVGRNYREHAKELNHAIPTEPLIFLKPPSAVIGPEEAISRPHTLSQRVDHEGEVGVVIGKRCYQISPSEDVRQYVLGYTCVNDVTARDLQSKDGQWTRAKGFDTFCPVGPVIAAELDPWTGIHLETRVNGQIRQTGTTADFLFPLDVILRYITQIMTLLPGDLIATGTPAGVGPLQSGDVVLVTVEGVGTLRNPVVDLA